MAVRVGGVGRDHPALVDQEPFTRVMLTAGGHRRINRRDEIVNLFRILNVDRFEVVAPVMNTGLVALVYTPADAGEGTFSERGFSGPSARVVLMTKAPALAPTMA